MQRNLEPSQQGLIARRSFVWRGLALGLALLARPDLAGAQASVSPTGSESGEPLKPFDVAAREPDVVLLMLFGGDNNLSAFVYQDLQEMAAGLRNERVAVLGLTDLPNRPCAVVEVTRQRGIHVVESWGDIDKAEPKITSRFLARALVTFPRSRKALGLWDHGTGVFDETDTGNSTRPWGRRIHALRTREDRSISFAARRLFFPKSRLADDRQMREKLHDDTSGAILANQTAREILAPVLGAASAPHQIDVIFSDTCLEGSIEALEEIGPLASSIVASPDLEPGDGWDYQRWLRDVTGTMPATADALARTAVEAMQAAYEGQPKRHPVTLAAYRSANSIADAFAALLAAAREGAADTFIQLDYARAKTQGFARSDTYDLRDFTQRLLQGAPAGNRLLAEAAQGLTRALDEARIANCSLGRTVPDSAGLSFWFPSSRTRMNQVIADYERLTFSRRSGWAEYLKTYR